MLLLQIVDAPSGKPITVHTLTGDPSSAAAAVFTHVGLTQTDANVYFRASSHKFQNFIFFRSAFNNV